MNRLTRRQKRRARKAVMDLTAMLLLAGMIYAAIEQVAGHDYPAPPITGHQLAQEYSREWRE